MSKPIIPAGFAICDIPDGLFADMTGPIYIRHDADGPRFGFLAEPRHGNDMKTVHGGMLMTLADQVLGLSVMMALDFAKVVTISLNCDFVSAAFPGQWVEGQAQIVRKTNSLIFVRGFLWVGDAVVVSASGLWKRARPETTTKGTPP